MIFNDRLDAAIALFFMAIVVVVLLASMREWLLVASRRKAPEMTETPFVESRLARVRRRRSLTVAGSRGPGLLSYPSDPSSEARFACQAV